MSDEIGGIEKVEAAGKEGNKIVFDALKDMAKSEDKQAREEGGGKSSEPQDGPDLSEGLKNGDED